MAKSKAKSTVNEAGNYTKPSAKTGERYLPSKAIKSLSDGEYASTTRAKREGTKAGKQHVAQPKKIAEKTARYRRG